MPYNAIPSRRNLVLPCCPSENCFELMTRRAALCARTPENAQSLSVLSAHGNCPHGPATAPFSSRRTRRGVSSLSDATRKNSRHEHDFALTCDTVLINDVMNIMEMVKSIRFFDEGIGTIGDYDPIKGHIISLKGYLCGLVSQESRKRSKEFAENCSRPLFPAMLLGFDHCNVEGCITYIQLSFHLLVIP
jgi:hypothetical protein